MVGKLFGWLGKRCALLLRKVGWVLEILNDLMQPS